MVGVGGVGMGAEERQEVGGGESSNLGKSNGGSEMEVGRASLGVA